MDWKAWCFDYECILRSLYGCGLVLLDGYECTMVWGLHK
jgi:hypothetical protein